MNLDQWVNLLWSYRINRDFVSFEKHFLRFKILADAKPTWKSEQKLLEVALLRSQGKIDESQIAAHQLLPELADPARVLLQIGLNHLACGEDLHAWPLFARSADETQDLLTRILALGNLVVCFNHLGLDHQQRLQELENQTRLYIQQKGPGHEAIASQNLAQRLRDDFRQREWQVAFARFEKSDFKKGQPLFLMAWMSQLPYLDELRKNLNWIFDEMMDDRSLYQQSSRIQTVLGIQSRDVKLSFHERVDRLYLWLWKHMTSPETIPFTWIAWEVDELMKEKKAVASSEDLAMIRNIFGWIQFFEGLPVFDLNTRLAFTGRRSDRLDQVFEDEWLFLQKLYKHTCADLKDFENFKPLKSELAFFKALKNSHFPLRAKSLLLRKKPLESRLRLFCKDSLFMNQKEQFHHPLLAKFICLMHQENSVSFERISKEVFGSFHEDYDFFIPQIQRLLVSARKVLGSKSIFSLRGPFVIKNEPILIEFIQEDQIEKPSDFLFWQKIKLAIEKPVKSAPLAMKRNQFPDWLLELKNKTITSRIHLEEKNGWSKATANRKIADALKKGWLVRNGQGARVMYEIKTELPCSN